MNLTLQIVCLIALAPLVHGAMRSVRARLCGRPGPSPLQPYRDLRKLLAKEALAPEATSVVFRAAPGVVFGVALSFAVLVPPIGSDPATPVNAVALVLVLALGRCTLVLAALDARSGFAAMAASREMTFASLTEAPLLLALLSTSIAAALPGAPGPGGEAPVAGVLAAFALLLVMLSEIARVPVDNQETHYELTMIHEGLVLEYSGWHLALLQAAAYIRQAGFVILAARMLPGGALLTLAWIAGLVVVIPAIERTTAKLRLFVVPQLFTSATILALASIGLRIAGRGAW